MHRMLVLVVLVFGSVDLFAQSPRTAVSLFDGKTLSGWKAFPADQNLWKAVDSIIIGGDGVRDIPSNLYLHIEKDSTVLSKGIIAFQLHSGGAAKVELRDLTINEL